MSAAPGAVVPAVTLGEFAQAKIRCWMNLALITLALIAYQNQPALGLLTIWYTFLFTAISAAALLMWARVVSTHPPNSRARVWQRIASIVLDNISVSWILYFGGETLAGVFSVYLWITIGYGMRFGLRYLFANLVTSIVGFAIVATQSPFWILHPFLAFGLAIGLIVLPLYAAFLIRQLHEAVRRAESASRAKGDFLAKMSHELRTPLHGIIALADLLGGTESATQRTEMLRQISVSSNTLLDLINRILDISKFESGSFALQHEPMNLHAVLDDTISILSSQAKAKGLALSAFYDAGVENRLMGSPRQLQEVLINIAGNALKFTTVGSVQIRLVGNASTANHVSFRISIADTGPGIHKDYLQRIFDPFSQADDSITRQHGGTGLGTTIARDIVSLMGGQILVESELGAGTTVNIELTLEKSLRKPRLATEYPLRVAVIGAAPQSLSTLQARLKELGVFEVATAAVGDLVQADCGFLDLTMPLDARARFISSISTEGPLALPLIGFGDEGLREVAIQLSLLGFVPSELPPAALRRALDLAMLALTRAEDEAECRSEGNGHLVLIAEDNGTNQMIARIALERAGYRCTIVEDGNKTLEELSSGLYDLALIDMHMPHMDGLEVARLYNFAVGAQTKRTPIVMLTADNRPDVVADAELAGILRFLVKPIKPSALLRVVHDLLEARATPTGALHVTSIAPAPLASVATAAPETTEVDPLILAELLSYMNTSEARQLFGEFLEDAHQAIASVHRAGEAEIPFSIIRDAMHALCGAARTVGAVKLAAMARRIEYAKEAEVRAQPGVYVAGLEAALAAASAHIEERLGVPA